MIQYQKTKLSKLGFWMIQYRCLISAISDKVG